MNLFRWLVESYDLRPGDRGGRSRLRVLVTFVLSLGLLGGWIYLVFWIWGIHNVFQLAGLALLTVAYLHIGYSASQVGWLDRMIDGSLGVSPGWQGVLISPFIILWPGRFVSESLVDMAGLLRSVRRSSDRCRSKTLRREG